ncbi:MAG: LuxR C-terminal-related transcriptional regulator [bacterium]|nr:LuxR C-terminal-related transcriptional regulator [bacterium]
MRRLFDPLGSSPSPFFASRSPDENRAPRKAQRGMSGAKEEKAVARPTRTIEPVDISQLMTPRQRQIVAMLESGSSNKQIATALGLAEGTIKVQLHSVYQKIGVSGRRQLKAKLFPK